MQKYKIIKSGGKDFRVPVQGWFGKTCGILLFLAVIFLVIWFVATNFG